MRYLLPLVLFAAPAHAAERGYTVTSFDRIRVEGPYRVEVNTGQGPSARASGDARALDALSVRVEGRMLIVRRGSGGWGGFANEGTGGATVRVTTPALAAASLAGAGLLRIDSMRGARVDLAVEGSGRLALGRVEADRLGVIVGGSGAIALAGTVKDAHALVRGQADLDAAGLTALDADVIAETSGAVTLAATRKAAVQASGSGTVTIAGDPACTVRNLGAGTVACGKDDARGE